jgi:AcrR family transcriptional regulator
VVGSISQAAPTLREEHKAATRQRILRAVTELLVDHHPAALSIPAVATRSGVSVPTIYRYFPTKEALLDAAAMFGLESHWLGIAVDLSAIDRWVGQTWGALQKALPMVKAQHMSPLGQEMRRRRGEHRRNEVRASLRDAGIDPDSAAGQRLEALVSLLISSAAFLQLHETQGLPPDQAVAYASWAISELLAATTREDHDHDADDHPDP